MMSKQPGLNGKLVAAYVRVSTEEQKIHGLSIDAQIEAIKAWAASNGVEIAGFYNDAGFSARKQYSKRPAMVQLLKDIQAGKVDLIVFTKLDRWFRSLKDYYKVQEILDANNVAWRAIQEDYETVTASGRFKVNIMLSVAENEADRTSERIKVINEAKKQRGEALTGVCPVGYKIVKKKFVKDPEKEAAVSELFKKFLECGSSNRAREYVNREYGVGWSYQVVNKLLRSTAYYGEYYGVSGMCPPYIAEDEYKKIQSMRAQPTRKSPKNRIYIFSGLVFCGECRRRMNGSVNQNKKSPNYRCQWHYGHKQCSNNVCMGEKKIEAYLMDSLDFKIAQYKANAIAEWETRKHTDYSKQIAKEKVRLSRLKELYLNELISLEDYKKDRENIETDLRDMEKRSAETAPPSFENIDQLLKVGWKDAYMDIGREEKQAFWRMIIKEIWIYSDRHMAYELAL